MTDYKAIKLIKNGCEYCFPSGGGGSEGTYQVDYLLVAGGGGGGKACNGGGGGGGAGGVIYRKNVIIGGGKYRVIVGKGGTQLAINSATGASSTTFWECIKASQGGDSAFNGDIAKGGGPGEMGVASSVPYGYAGGSGGGGGACLNYACVSPGGGGVLGQGNNGYRGLCGSGGQGGGAGSYNEQTRDMSKFTMPRIDGIYTYMDGTLKIYASGGASGYYATASAGADGTLGSGGGGGGCNCPGGKGGDGIFILKYPSTAGYNITGGCKYECNGYCIHCFTDSGDLTVGDADGCYVSYLAVGGGGAGYYSGGGGGAVYYGSLNLNNPETCIVIGSGGTTYGASGGDTEICGYIIAPGGKGGGTSLGGMSGSGNRGGITCYCVSYSNYAGGGGAAGIGCETYCGGIYQAAGGNGGIGYFGYGGGGGGAAKYDCYGHGFDGGGAHVPCNCAKACGNAKDCGGGGGGAFYGGSCFGNGGNGVVDICYACDGSYGFSCATGGDCCYLCGDICVHRFTSNGTFTIVS